MVFMRQDEGRPVPALLLLFSMFAFACVFHVVTRPSGVLPAMFDTQVAPLAHSIASSANIDQPAPAGAASVIEPALAAQARSTGPLTLAPPVVEQPALPALTATAATTLMFLPPSIDAVPAQLSVAESGAVTRAALSTGAAVRNAFKKAF